MSQTNSRINQSGQALILLLVLMVVAITVLSAAVIITIISSQSASNEIRGQFTLDIAESGAENALLRLLRDPDFTGETIQVNGGTSISSVSGTPNKIITVDGKLSGFTRKIQVIVSYNNNILNILSWKEITP